VTLLGAPPASMEASEAAAGSVGRLTRFGAWSIVAYAAKAGAAFAVSIVVARGLGADSLGRYSYQIWIMSLVPVLMALGVPIALNRVLPDKFGAGDADGALAIFRWVRRIHVVALGLPAAVAAFLLLGTGANPVLVVAVTVGIAAGLLILDYQALLTALRRFRILAVAAVAGAVVQIAGALVGTALGVSWEGFVLLSALTLVLGLGVLVAVSRPRVRTGRSRRVAPEERRRFMRYALITSFAVAANAVIWGRPELFFLDRYGSDQELGLYAAALRLTALAAPIPIMAGQALMPEFSWLRGSGQHEALARAFPRVCTLLAALTAPLAFGGAIVAGAMTSVVFGGEFSGGGTAASVLLAGAMVNALAPAATAAVLTGPRPRLAAEAGAVLVALTLLLDVLLIPPFGPVGAAIANVAAQIVGVLIGLVYAWHWLGLRYPVGNVLVLSGMAILSGLTALASIHLIGGAAGLGFGVACAAVVYVVLVGRSGIVTATDLRALLRREAVVP